jgi:prolyl-tRNA editing enzyme YbaK/EbsC (Cys-tRNA(Pro) deacylase)
VSAKQEPVTQAVRVLRAAGVAFEGHSYDDQAHGGTAQVARSLGIDEPRVVKTLIMEDGAGRPLIVLMHGDRELATGLLSCRSLDSRSDVPGQHQARPVFSGRSGPGAPRESQAQ